MVVVLEVVTAARQGVEEVQEGPGRGQAQGGNWVWWMILGGRSVRVVDDGMGVGNHEVRAL